MSYQTLTDPFGKPSNTIRRVIDNAFIPFDEANTDYQAYLAWVAEGNIAEEWSSDAS
jgi:hypothetical protein